MSFVSYCVSSVPGHAARRAHSVIVTSAMEVPIAPLMCVILTSLRRLLHHRVRQLTHWNGYVAQGFAVVPCTATTRHPAGFLTRLSRTRTAPQRSV